MTPLTQFPLERWAGQSRLRWAVIYAALFALMLLAGGIAPMELDA